MADERVVPVEIAAGEMKVTFTVKELLADIKRGIEHVEEIAQNAATRDSMDAVLVRVDKLEREAEGTKAVATALLSADTNRWSRNEKVVGLFIGAAALTPALSIIVNLFR